MFHGKEVSNEMAPTSQDPLDRSTGGLSDKTLVPLGLAVRIGCFLLGVALAGGAQVVAWRYKFNDLDARILRNSKACAENIAAFESRLVGRGPNGWHREQERQWCEDFKRLNPDLDIPDPTLTRWYDSSVGRWKTGNEN